MQSAWANFPGCPTRSPPWLMLHSPRLTCPIAGVYLPHCGLTASQFARKSYKYSPFGSCESLGNVSSLECISHSFSRGEAPHLGHSSPWEPLPSSPRDVLQLCPSFHSSSSVFFPLLFPPHLLGWFFLYFYICLAK